MYLQHLYCVWSVDVAMYVGSIMSAVAVVNDPLHPFNHPQDGPRARAFTPDNMEPEEMQYFPEYCK